MAPLTTRRQKKALAVAPAPPPPVIDPADAVIDPSDRISRLPEEIQAQILSFLPSEEAVRTCILARTWRHIWKFTRRLLITADSVQADRQFVDRLLRVRLDGLNVACLDASEIGLYPSEEVDASDPDDVHPSEYYYSLNSEDNSCIKRWIRRVLKCGIKMLRVEIDICGIIDGYLEMSNKPLAWKFTRGLLITADSVQADRQFVDRLLRVRLDGLELASLDACEIGLHPSKKVDFSEHYSLDDEDKCCINTWIRRVLKCRIKMLCVEIDICGSSDGYLEMSNAKSLASQHLTRLELTGLQFVCRCLNLDGCPVLEHLEINECYFLGVRKIMFQSLKRLVITSCDSHNYDDERIQICVPRLVSLLLDNTHSPDGQSVMTPRLERMPELAVAKVWIDSYMDYCDNCDSEDDDSSGFGSDSDDNEDHEESSGGYAGQNTTKCLVLEGLAEARDLVLIATRPTYIFKRDLRWCPTFCKLKTR